MTIVASQAVALELDSHSRVISVVHPQTGSNITITRAKSIGILGTKFNGNLNILDDEVCCFKRGNKSFAKNTKHYSTPSDISNVSIKEDGYDGFDIRQKSR